VKLVLLGSLALLVAGCGAGGVASGHGPLQVVAAENVWGSIASQLGGSRVRVASVIANPATDPHDYESNASDARLLASARLAIVNGVGYDPWASKLLASNPVGRRIVLTVGDVVGVAPGGNPHRWYSPADVQRVIAAITRDYAQLDPRDAAYFRSRRRAFQSGGLARYRRLIATIRSRYHGVPVGASESIFVPLAGALGLKLVTPSGFLDAISEGAEPTAADLATIDRQIARHEIKAWVVNRQNSTPDVKRLTEAAHRSGIPVTTITETLVPATASFQAWQSSQLEALLGALATGTGR
jgi:zinc/manganese transport system substrate-binding protein